ncbi:MAG: GNAT family N-acetyltransferase [Betaproteobacteria bacterium]
MTTFDEVTLPTPRLVLRPLREADASALFAIFSDPRVARYLSRPAWPTISTAHERIARDIDALAACRYLCLGLERKEDQALIGECSLFNLFPQCRRAEMGYSLGADCWGQGYMTEALTALLDFGFSQLALNRVEADIDPRNELSAKSLERLGFKKEGHLRERWIVAGEVSDSGLYGLLGREWQARGEQLAIRRA